MCLRSSRPHMIHLSGCCRRHALPFYDVEEIPADGPEIDSFVGDCS